MAERRPQQASFFFPLQGFQKIFMEGEEEYVFGKVPWLPEEKAAVQRLLETKIGIDKASLRPGPANSALFIEDFADKNCRNNCVLCCWNNDRRSEQYLWS